MRNWNDAVVFCVMAALGGFGGSVVSERWASAEGPFDVFPEPASMRQLFDGQTLRGWHGQPQMDPAELASMPTAERDARRREWAEQTERFWSVENGEIVSSGEGPFLVTDQKFENYALSLEYKIQPLADSGVYLKDNPQVQIWDPRKAEFFHLGSQLGSGGLFNNASGADGKNPLLMMDRPIGQWNTMQVLQIGSRTSVRLNGQIVVDHAVMENFWDRDENLPRRGSVQLQTHGGEVRWRNLYAKELSAEVANQVLLSHERVSYRSIFDGRTLEGWIGAVDDYQVVGGSLMCREGRGGLLCYEQPQQDFEVKLEFRLPSGGNNGLAIRTPLDVDPAYEAMCELQILDNADPAYVGIDPRQRHGSAYGMVAARRGYLRPAGQWNFQHVRVHGSRVEVELNGYSILDADLSTVDQTLDDKPHPGLRRTEGYFGFAGHSDPVEFRSVLLRQFVGVSR